jgi:cytochrome P450
LWRRNDRTFTPQFFADPYPLCARLREASAVQYDQRLGWMVTRYDDIRALLKGGLLSRAQFEAQRLVGLSAEVCLAARPVMDGLNLEMMRRDPPAHTRLRGPDQPDWRLSSLTSPNVQAILRDLKRLLGYIGHRTRD